MANIFNIILYQPLFNALTFLYNTVAFQDLGVAIVLLTILVRGALYPLFYHGFKNQTVMQRLQPLIQRIQHDHKDNREKQALALMELYKQNKVNPFSSLFLILVQLPILIALYQLFLHGFDPESFTNLYSFISAPVEIHNSFLGLIDLKSKSILIVVLAAVLQYFQGRLSLPAKAAGPDKKAEDDNSPTAKVGRSMVFIAPVLTILILSGLPSAVGIYWFTSSAFSIFQQLLINKSLNNERRIQNEDKNNP